MQGLDYICSPSIHRQTLHLSQDCKSDSVTWIQNRHCSDFEQKDSSQSEGGGRKDVDEPPVWDLISHDDAGWSMAGCSHDPPLIVHAGSFYCDHISPHYCDSHHIICICEYQSDSQEFSIRLSSEWYWSGVSVREFLHLLNDIDRIPRSWNNGGQKFDIIMMS